MARTAPVRPGESPERHARTTLAVALHNSERLFDRLAIDACDRRAWPTRSRHDYAGAAPVYLTVMHGGMSFASQLALELGLDLEFDYLHATRYRGATTGGGLDWLHRPATPLRRPPRVAGRRHPRRGPHADGGAQLVRGPGRDATCASRCWRSSSTIAACAGIEADYVGLEVPDRYVFGFGMDYHEQGRNLPGIYALK